MVTRVGDRIRTRIGDADTDELGNLRLIPSGSEGKVVGFDGELYDIAWDNGGWTRWTAEELAEDGERTE